MFPWSAPDTATTSGVSEIVSSSRARCSGRSIASSSTNTSQSPVARAAALFLAMYSFPGSARPMNSKSRNVWRRTDATSAA